MSRIFISFFNAVQHPDDPHAMPCFYESFIKELAERGNELLVMHHHVFSQDFGPLPESIKAKITEFSPDFAVIFNNAFYDLSEHFDFPVYIYEVDSVLYYSNKDVLLAKKDRFRYIVPQISSIDTVHDLLGVDRRHILHVPFFSSVRREDVPKTMNISFIGTRFTPCGGDGRVVWNRFMSSSPSAAEVKSFRRALDEVRHNPYIPQQKLREKFCGEGPDTEAFLNRDEMVSALSGSIRILTLSAVSDLGLVIFGTESWATENCADPNIPLSYNNRAVYSLKHNQDVYNASRLAINVNHVQATSGFSWRVCDILASDACLVSEYKPDFERCFPGVPIPLFTSRYEARELCRKLLDNENMRRDIVARCNEVIDAKFRFANLVPQLEDFLGFSLCGHGRKAAPVSMEAVSEENVSGPAVLSGKLPCAGGDKSILRDVRKRYKLFFYLMLLLFSQIPGAGMFLPAETRARLLRKINKYWR